MSDAIDHDTIVTAIVDILKEAETILPQDVVDSIKKAASEETSPVAKEQLEAILKNIEIAGSRKVPICQDTGILIFFVELGRKAVIDCNIEEAILEGVRVATDIIPLRPNAVDPISRSNSGNNTGSGIPDIKYELVEGSSIKITVAPKGAGSENMSAIKMFNPTEKDRIRNFVLETVMNAGGKPCPPIVVGVGIGGSFDKAARLAKSALLEKIDEMDEEEMKLLEDINSLGIGPMGLGGRTTALATHIKKAHCHTASLPVAVNIQCWANRHASVTLGGDQ
ncbi:fumarate hydratase [Methanolobus profundi]|uniref:Fumarase, class I alpha subunit n=1 Tax=Methanolobus profundi TaxID=487685 RepID=A0A1I4S230_9EURY|nr:fumarate hydratase [Methanolobus profundi]SFM58545.1 fumarase, class I alpha subunit [Methanolobus profundi]